MFGCCKKKDCENEKVVQVSEIMDKFGKFQVVQYIIVCLTTALLGMVTINYVFLAQEINYRCIVPECESAPYNYSPSWWPDQKIDHCHKPVLNDFHFLNDTCTNTSFTGHLQQCSAWDYESRKSVIVDLNLACQPWKVSIIGSVHNIGMMFSVLISGWIADRYGRKWIMVISVLGGCLGHIKPSITSYYGYLAMEFVEAFITAGFYCVSTVMMIEVTGIKHRLLSGILFMYALYGGDILFSCIAMFTPDWITLARIIYTPSLFLVVLLFFIKESPRWLIVSGQYEKAKQVLLEIANMNDINVNKEQIQEISDTDLRLAFDVKDSGEEETVGDAFRSKELTKRIILCAIIGFTTTLVDFGMSLNSVFLPGNKYLNYIISTLLALPGDLVSYFIMNRYGRRIPLIVILFSSGVFCISSGVMPDSYVWTKKVFFYVGRMLAAISYTGGLPYSMELFPTSVRGGLNGINALIGRVGAALAPATTALNSYSIFAPSLLFGVLSVLTTTCFFFLPETNNTATLETIEQLEESLKPKEEQVEIVQETVVIKPDYIYYNEVHTHL